MDSPKPVGKKEAPPAQVEEEEIPPVSVEVAQPNILKELSPSKIKTGVLSEPTPQDEVIETEFGGKEEPNNAPIVVLRKILRRVNWWESQPEQ